MKSIRNNSAIRFAAASVVLLSHAFAQPWGPTPAGRTVLTFVNRLVINPPQVLVFGYFPTIHGLPGLLFSGAPGEATAYFTWSLDAAGGIIVQNGDPKDPTSTQAAVLPVGHTLNVYFNANPNQSWDAPATFSTGQLVATFKSGTGTQTGAGPVALVTQSYVLVSSADFSFKGQTYNLAKLLPYGFTSLALSSNIPLGNPNPAVPPLTFTAAGSGFAMGGPLSGLPYWGW